MPWIRGTRPSASPPTSTTATRCSRSSQEQRFEGIVAKRASSVYRPGKRTRDWLKLKIDSTGRLRDRGLHARLGPAGTDVRLARPRSAEPTVSCGTSATSARVSTTPRSSASSDCWRRCSAIRRPSRPSPRCRGCERTPSNGSNRGCRRGSGSASGRTKATCGSLRISGFATTCPSPRPTSVPTCCAAAGASCGCRTSRRSSGRTRGSRRETCSTTTRPSRRCSYRTLRTGR